MPISDDMKDFTILAVLSAFIGGIAAMVLGIVLGTITGAIGFATIIGGLLAAVFLLAIAAATDLDKFTVFELLVLMVLIGVVGTAVVTVVPAASSWVLNTGGALTVNGLSWTMVYIGTAFFVKEKFL